MRPMNTNPTSPLPAALAMFNLTGRVALVTGSGSGIGPKKRAKLLQRFGGVRGVADASVQDLCAVEGISPELAQTIYQALR